MTEDVKADIRQTLQRWLEERDRSWRERFDALCREGLERDLEDGSLLESLAALTPPVTPAPAGPAFEPLLGEGLALLEAAQSQGEVLKRLLEAIRPLAGRSALFVVKQGIASLYTSLGFEGESPRPGSPVIPPSELEAMISGRIHRLDRPGPAYESLLSPLSRFEAESILILPLRLRRRTVAVLLADSGLAPSLDHPNTIRTLLHVAESCISYLAGQKEEDRTSSSETSPGGMTQQLPDPISETIPPPPPVDPKVRANAERSARVLVGDIELYFPGKVEQGRSAGSLYALLRDELDRSRASFVERYGEDLERHHRIFASTVVQQLCGGDPALLGPAPWA
nr:hypothetical protein [uncultured Holophaga sp.]